MYREQPPWVWLTRGVAIGISFALLSLTTDIVLTVIYAASLLLISGNAAYELFRYFQHQRKLDLGRERDEALAVIDALLADLRAEIDQAKAGLSRPLPVGCVEYPYPLADLVAATTAEIEALRAAVEPSKVRQERAMRESIDP